MPDLHFTYTDPEGQTHDFSSYYEEKIYPQIEHLEKQRQEALALYHKRKRRAIPFFIAYGLLVLLCIVASIADFIASPIATLLTFPAIFHIVWLVVSISHPVQEYEKNLKEKIYPLIFAFFGDDFTYQREDYAIPTLNAKKLSESLKAIATQHQHHTTERLKPSCIIPPHNESTREDFISGSYKEVGMHLFQATLSLVEHNINTKNKETKCMFKGLIIQLNIPTFFKGETIIHTDLGGFQNWLRDILIKHERVMMEDATFEDAFAVYSTAPQEARKLVTAEFMKGLVALKEMFHGGTGLLQASFYERHLLLTIPSERLFTLGPIDEPLTFEHEINTILKEMQVIFQMIDLLELSYKHGY